MDKRRCHFQITDKITKRKRNCKNKSQYYYCKLHQTPYISAEIAETELLGTCCFCGYDCNPCSQACGSCIRKLSLFGHL
jgi:hypothetical protein